MLKQKEVFLNFQNRVLRLLAVQGRNICGKGKYEVVIIGLRKYQTYSLLICEKSEVKGEVVQLLYTHRLEEMKAC